MGPAAMEKHDLFTKAPESDEFVLEEGGESLASQVKSRTPGVEAAIAATPAEAPVATPSRALINAAAAASTVLTSKAAGKGASSTSLTPPATTSSARKRPAVVLTGSVVPILERMREALATNEDAKTAFANQRYQELYKAEGETIDVLVAVPRILAQVESEANAKFGAVDALRTDLSSAMATYEAEVAAAEAKAAAALAHFEGEFPKALQAAKKARR